MKRYLLLLVLIGGVQTINAQGLRERYESFKQHSVIEYLNFRKACNDRYVEFLRQSWIECEAQKVIVPPQEEWLPPVTMDEDNQKPIKDNLIPSEPVVVFEEDTLRPKPIASIADYPVQPTLFQFTFFNTPMQVRIADNSRFRIKSLDENGIADSWQFLSGPAFDNMILDCLQLRDNHHLCDWAYLLMLNCLSSAYLEEENEVMLLTAYLFSQSGYQMRLGMAEGKISLLVATDYVIYNHPFFAINGNRYWILGNYSDSMKIVGKDYPEGLPLSLALNEVPEFSWTASNPRLLTSLFANVATSCQINLNLLAFFELYPNAQLGDNPMTRWVMYANTPLDPVVQYQLYPSLERAMFGKSLPEAANILLNFVQTAFEYQYDEKLWGHDRAFFAEESLFYPYADCEDRSILYSRLVRDLLGLDVVLVYYPGHLATAVKFPMQVPGDYLELESGRYLICDPTYIGAPIGMSMPGMDNQMAKAILLK